MKNIRKIWKAATVLGLAVAILAMEVSTLRAAQADTQAIVEAASQIIYDNEGSYDSVNPNDNGAVSIGKLQWHAWRALALLQTIVSANEEQAQDILGDTLYKEIRSTKDTSKWSTRKFTSKEAAAVKKLLAKQESKDAQDALAAKDITSYIQQGQRLGITNEPALVYFADLTNQGGSGASGRVGTAASKIVGSYGAVTLNEIHEAAICDAVMGRSAYLKRRFLTYRYAAGLGWEFCNEGDSYIPYDEFSSTGEGAAWLQRGLNACMDAGLTVSGTYDAPTEAAVIAFQKEKKLEVDGEAGKNTIVALIKALVAGEHLTIQQPQDPGNTVVDPDTPADPGNTEDPSIPTDPGNTEDPSTPTDPGNTEDPSTPADPGNTEDPSTPTDPGNTEDPGTPTDPEQPEETHLHASKTSYAINDNHGPFRLDVSSSRTDKPLMYQSSKESTVQVDAEGRVTVTGAGQAKITVSQARSDTHAAAKLTISVTVYSTDPSNYTAPKSALYAGKNMKKQNVQWLQAALIALGQKAVTVNGSWSDTLTQRVVDFQKKCGLEADGIVGEATQKVIKDMLAVKAKKPALTVKASTKANTLTWKKYGKANRVYIYRKTKSGSSQRIKTIKNMSKASCQDTSAASGKTYYYTIKFGYVQGQVKVASPSSNSVKSAVRKK